jgi:Zn-finger domain-containing protein
MKNVCEDEINHTIQKKFDLKGSTLGRIASVEERRKKCPVLKDQDFSNYLLSLGNKSEPFLKQLRIDTDFLASIGLMDYSVFLGVHFIDQCQNSHEEFYKRNSSRFSPSVSIDPIQHIKYGNAIYHIGIIDIFTSYNAKKRIETFVKSILHKKEEISSIDPEHYSNRLFDFIKNHMYD